ICLSVDLRERLAFHLQLHLAPPPPKRLSTPMAEVYTGQWSGPRPNGYVCTIIEVMSTQSVCEKCGGTGWIIVERSSVSGAERCACLSAGRAERLEERSQIPPLYRNASFENFKTEGVQELKSVMSDVKRYADEFDPLGPFPGLLLIGEPGTGKTHLAVAALRRIMQKGFEGVDRK